MRMLRHLLLGTVAQAALLPACARRHAVLPARPAEQRGGNARRGPGQLHPSHPSSTFAKLSSLSLVYPNAFTTAPSDSYSSMIAQVTGASPRTAGLFYDDSDDRDESSLANLYLSQELANPGRAGAPDTEVTNFEELDKTHSFATALVADIAAAGTIGHVLTSSTRTTCSVTS